jgi:TolB-like protein/tetratricopeptide (TPR) repeat protein
MRDMGRAINERFGYLWRELHRRRVLHAVGFYLAGSWLILQVFDVALLEVGFPKWSLQLSVWLVIIGFPVVALISWRYDFTLNGFRRTPPAIPGDKADLSLKSIDYLVIILVFVFILGVSLILTQSLRNGFPDSVARDIRPNSIAVLPFQNMMGRPEDEYLATGLAEDILHRLAIMEDLHVASRTAAFELDVSDLDISVIGQRLGVKSLLEGSVRKDGNRLRIVAQLIDTESGYHLWSGSYDREMEDLFGIYDEISTAVVGELQLTLAPDSLAVAPPTSDIQAYDYFLQARSMLQTGKHDYDAFRKARSLVQNDAQAYEFFDQAQSLLQNDSGVASASNAHQFFARAVELDPEFARAWAGRCQALMDWYWYQPDDQKIELAKSSCLRALELEPGLSEGHVALGDLYRKTGWLEDSIDEYQAALENDVDNAGAWLGLGETFATQNRDIEAEHAMNRAVDLDPDDLRSYYSLGAFLFKHGRYPDAASVYSQLASHPNADASAFNGQGIAYSMMGDFSRAAKAYRQVIATTPTAVAYSNVGTQYYYDGQFEDAAVMYRQAIALGSTNPVWWGNLGDALQQMDGGRATSLEAYREAANLAGEMLQANPNDVETLTNLAHYHARLGEDEQAMQYLAQALIAAPHDFYAYYYAALVHLEVGRRELALDAIQHSVELGYPAHLLRKDPQFTKLQNNEDFSRLMMESAGMQVH